MNTKNGLLLVGFVLLGAVAVVGAPGTAVADEAACGSKENPCPLQKWMRTNMGPAMASNDLPVLAKALEKSAALSPDPSWEWASMAKAGADAAKKGDLAGAKASCKSCHDKYKDAYKTKFRAKPVAG